MTQDILITPGSGEPQILFRGSGTNDTPIELNVLSSYQSASGSGTALVFEGQEGQLFAVTDNLSSGTIFSVGDITGLSMLSVDASGDVKLGEFANKVIVYPGLTLDDNVPDATSNVLYNDGGDLMWNGVVVLASDAAQAINGSGTASYVARFTDSNTLSTGVLYDNGTNVGIGTASPSYKLDVNGTTRITPTASSTTLILDRLSGQPSIKGGSDGYVMIESNGAGKYISLNHYVSENVNLVNGGGNVGIGTVSPSEKLHVVGNIKIVDGSLNLDNDYGISYNPLEGSVETLRYCLKFDATNNASYPFLTNRTPNGKVVIKTGTSAGGAENTHFTIEGGDGVVNSYFENTNIGIGTASPQQKLHIDEGNIRIEKTTDPTVEFNNGSANRASIFYDTSEETFVLNHADASLNQLVLTSGNNVGVGTNDPNATLHIYSATSGYNVFNVEGTNGSLFGVTDNLSGVLMSVNTIAGLPVLEVNSDYSVTAGRFNQNDFVISSSGNIGLGTDVPSEKLYVEGKIVANNFVVDSGTSSQFLKADGSIDSNSYFQTTGGTITGNVTLSGADGENALTLTGTSPTMAFTDSGSADDFYIHVNSNNFYILTDRGGGGSYADWEEPHPMQLEADTNIGYLFGSRIFADNYHPNADKWTSAVTITLGGDLTGSVNLDGSANVTLSGQVTNDSHTHAWQNITAGTRTNFDLDFKPQANNYAGFRFTKSTSSNNTGDAGFLLVRGTSDNAIYTAEGITLVADASWLTLAQRTQTDKGVRIMTGGTSAERLKIDSAGNVEFLNSNSLSYNSDELVITNNGDVGIGKSSPNATLHVYSATSGTDLFNVEGTNGSLFSIVDSLSGSLMSVNNIVGLPVFEVFDDDTVIAGRYGENDLYVSSSGNVGLGTASPTEKLHVEGNIRVSGAYYDSSNSPGTNGQILSSTVSGTDWVSLTEIQGVDGTGGAGQVAFWTDTDTISGESNLYWDSSNDRLGIGTTSPARKLQIDGDILFNNYALIAADGGSTNIDHIWHDDTGTGNAGGIWHFVSDGAYKSNGNARVYAGGFYGSQSNQNNYFAGNVGIGTTSPSQKLHIVGDQRIENATDPKLEFHDGAAVGAYVKFDTSEDNLVLSHVDVAGDNQIALANDGNVGIGTSAPNAVLHAYGSTPSGTVFNVEGTNGSLFSVVDNLSGVLMSVNNNAGLPVFEVYDDDSIIAGRFAQDDFVISSGGNVGIGTDTPAGKLHVVGEAQVDNLKLDGNTLSSTNTNGNINITPNGTGGIAGGTAATVTGSRAVVGGGLLNKACGNFSTVSGGYCNTASGYYSIVSGGGGLFAGNIACNYAATVSGGQSNIAGGEGSTVSGGALNTASGISSTVSGGNNNKACATNSSVSGGRQNFVNARHGSINGGHYNVIQSPTNECCSRGATIGGGVGHNTSGGTVNGTTGDITGVVTCCNAGCFSTIGGGLRNCATGDYSKVGGGWCNTASGPYSTVVGGNKAKASRYGEVAHAAGRFAQTGDAQHSTFVARKNTTDATANVELFLDGVDDRMILTAETTWTFDIKLSAYNDTDNTAAWWIIRGGIRRNAANVTTLIGSLIEERDYEGTMSGTSAAVTADDTNESLKIAVTGLASKNIRWVAVVDVAQVSWGTP